MQTVATSFLRAKHWQIFLLIAGVPWIGGAAAMLRSFATARVPEEMLKAALPFGLLMALSMVFVVAWLWSMGSFLNSAAQPTLRRPRRFFLFAIVYPMLYMFVFVAILTTANPLLLAALFPLHFFAMFCLFYDFYFVSKNLALAETHKAASFADWAGAFFLLWFFPIGVWFIQPRINRLLEESLLARKGIPRADLPDRAAEIVPSEAECQPTFQPVYAGFWPRVAAALIDGFVICVPMYMLLFFTFVVLWKVTAGNGGGLSKGILAALVMLMLAVPWLYFSLLESSRWQATVGKRALRLYVTDIEGHRLSRARSMGRNLAKCLSTLTLGVGYLVCGFTARRQALHDLAAHCVILRR